MCSLVCRCVMPPAEVTACIFFFFLLSDPLFLLSHHNAPSHLFVSQSACSGRSPLVCYLFFLVL